MRSSHGKTGRSGYLCTELDMTASRIKEYMVIRKGVKSTYNVCSSPMKFDSRIKRVHSHQSTVYRLLDFHIADCGVWIAELKSEALSINQI